MNIFVKITRTQLPSADEQVNICTQCGFMAMLLSVFCLFTGDTEPQIVCTVAILGVSAIIDAIGMWLLDSLSVFALVTFTGITAILGGNNDALSRGFVLGLLTFILFYLLYLFSMYFFGDVKYASVLGVVAGYQSLDAWMSFAVFAILFTGIMACAQYVRKGKNAVFPAGPALFVALLVSLCVN
jgi:hypothetical protein